MQEELITWEEAEWTREALGLNVAAFARLIGVHPTKVNWGRRNPQSILNTNAATLLKLGTNRRKAGSRVH